LFQDQGLKLLWTGLIGCAALAQVTGGDATFRTGVQEVLVPVVVRDSSGRPVGGLKAADFRIFDKGKPQTIGSFRAVGPSRPEALRGAVEGLISGAAGSVKPSRPTIGSTKPVEQERSVVYVFDDLNTRFADFGRMREAAERHFHAGLAGEVAAIRTFSGRISLPFTSDSAKLADTVKSLRVSLSVGHGEANPCPSVTFYLADYIVRLNDARALEAATQQTMDCAHLDHGDAQWMAESAAKREIFLGEQDIRVWVTTLRSAIRLLQERPAPRVLVLASSGFYAETPNGVKAIADTLDLAARASVTINALQARGIYVDAAADASRSRAPSALEQLYYRKSSISEEGALEDLAKGAGGDYFHNHNDLTKGFGDMAAPPDYSYILGFSPAALKLDGSFHALKIRVANRGSVRIEARPGYYAPHASTKAGAEAALTEEIDDAVIGRDERTDIPVDVSAEAVRSGTAPVRLSVAAKIHLKPVRYEQLAGRNHAMLTVVAVVFERDGGYVTGSRHTVNLMLPNERLTATEDPAANIQSNFQVQPGNYRVRVVVCESGDGAVSTRNIAVLVR
jgi:VWFA-related protein